MSQPKALRTLTYLFIRRERVLNSTLEEVNVQGLTPGSAYSLRVVAHNEHGVGHSSEPLVVSIKSTIFSSAYERAGHSGNRRHM